VPGKINALLAFDILIKTLIVTLQKSAARIYLRSVTVSQASSKTYSALLLLVALVFVGNNLAHDFDHILTSQTTGQIECDSCHISKEVILSQSPLLPVGLDILGQSSIEPISVGLNSRFSLYLSRAPPKKSI